MSRILRWCSKLGRSRLTYVLYLAVVFTIASLGAAQQNQSFAQNAPAVRHLAVVINKSETIRFDKPIKTATIASTAIADVTPMTDRSIYIQGKQIGTTNISVFDESMQLAEIIDLEVTYDIKSLQGKIRAATHSNTIRVSANGGEVVLTGTAPDAVVADQAMSLAKSIVPNVVNGMNVAPAQQVMLKVRFLEATRSAERDLGVNWYGTNPSGTRGFSTGIGGPVANNGSTITPAGNGVNVNTTTTVTPPGGSTSTSTLTSTTAGGISVIQSAGAILSTSGAAPFGVVLANLVNNGTGNLNVMVSALESKGLVRRLAEPDLVTLSGESAKFLAGGSFPVPTVTTTATTGATPTFQFVDYGVSLVFIPTVLKDGLINLHIAPEVSELDYTNAVTISGTTIPSILRRNASTTIELRDGQSFAIAGLLQNRNVRNLEQIPWLGSVPVLGTLFRSSAYQNNETDLVIIVTPHLVRPAAPVNHLATPFDHTMSSNDVDFFVNGQLEVPKQYSDYVTSGGGVQGPYGAIIPVEQGSNQPVYKGSVAK